MPRPELYPVKKIVGFDQVMIDRVEKWRARQKPIPNASEAIRRLVEFGLASMAPTVHRSKESRTKASLLAGKTIDKLNDVSASSQEQDKRKRRLLKGPSEFRELRKDRPKTTGL
jgi:Arc/MetJ-type ribon-helix-helix transcriptional regulator